MTFKTNCLTYLFLLFSILTTSAQVGIGTTLPDPSSILDVSSTTQGLLAPRMDTSERNAIVSPANGLLVFDTDEDAFYYYDDSAWVKLEGGIKRDNYKLIKSDLDLADELAAGGGSQYLMDPSTLYEINGTISLAAPININSSHIFGEDTGGDILIRSGGPIFQGNTGGNIRRLALRAPGGSLFNITGTGAENLIFRDCNVAGIPSLGTLSNLNIVYLSDTLFAANADGITFNNITESLCTNLAWIGNNGGTYMTYTGTFKNIQNQGGTIEVIGATAGIDITGITSITGGAGMRIIQFLGGGNYINGSSPYAGGYNFTKDWDINCPGIRVETDNNAFGDINLNYPIGFGATTAFTGTGAASRRKLLGITTSNNLFRFTSNTDNRITYDGTQSRFFGISSSISFSGSNNNAIFIFYLAKNGVVVDQTRVYREIGGNNDIGAVAVIGTLILDPGDYIEVWGERFAGTGNLVVASLNLIAR